MDMLREGRYFVCRGVMGKTIQKYLTRGMEPHDWLSWLPRRFMNALKAKQHRYRG